ncbi:MAG: DUF4157 domain-containing protein [Candidatus Bathyarchaeota archaeon]|nr:DUF4157 domain-containing protein [Candidatus Termiticorpusculum sp.]
MFDYAAAERKKQKKNKSDSWWPSEVQMQTETKKAPNLTGIPDDLKSKFERKSGFSFADVRVFYNSDDPARIGALAYTQGNRVHIGPGQERHLAHELGHVVQQKQGIVKPTRNIGGIPINDDAELECRADNGVYMSAIEKQNTHNVIQRQKCDDLDDVVLFALCITLQMSEEDLPSSYEGRGLIIYNVNKSINEQGLTLDEQRRVCDLTRELPHSKESGLKEYIMEQGGAAYDYDRKIIMYTTDDTGYNLVMSLCHELGHYLQGTSQLIVRGPDGDSCKDVMDLAGVKSRENNIPLVDKIGTLLLDYHNILINENPARKKISNEQPRTEYMPVVKRFGDFDIDLNKQHWLCRETELFTQISYMKDAIDKLLDKIFENRRLEEEPPTIIRENQRETSYKSLWYEIFGHITKDKMGLAVLSNLYNELLTAEINHPEQKHAEKLATEMKAYHDQTIGNMMPKTAKKSKLPVYS